MITFGGLAMNIGYILILTLFSLYTLHATHHPKRLTQMTNTVRSSVKKNIPSEIIKTLRQERMPAFDYDTAFSIEPHDKAFKNVHRKSTALYTVPSQQWFTLQNIILKNNMRRNYKNGLITFNKPYNIYKKLAQPLSLSEIVWHQPTHPNTTFTLLQHIVDAQGYSILPVEVISQIIDYTYGHSNVLKNALTGSALVPCLHIPATTIFKTMNTIHYRDIKEVIHEDKRRLSINHYPIPLSIAHIFNTHYIQRAFLSEASLA